MFIVCERPCMLQLFGGVDLLAVHAGDHVAGFEPRLVGRAAGHDLRDHDAVAGLVAADEPDAAASLGIAIARHKVLAFMVSGAMMSVAGTFYGQYVLVLDPERLFSAECS